jgi:hypothetical protein
VPAHISKAMTPHTFFEDDRRWRWVGNAARASVMLYIAAVPALIIWLMGFVVYGLWKVF